MMSLRWGLVVGGALLAELGILAIVLPVRLLFGEQAFIHSVPLACAVMTFWFGCWAARRAGTSHILHGTMVGVVAALLYIGLTWGQTLPFAFVVSHFIKVIGGAAGGAAARRPLSVPARA